ncbi:hypothetical protein JTB14_032511 [Gonioctena quinquepunctata]|nr:hypothetical protein JTB14_032511 [Gonioctena quinquepunctata]
MTALKGITATFRREDRHPIRRIQEGRVTPRSKTVAGGGRIASGSGFRLEGGNTALRSRGKEPDQGERRNVCSWAVKEALGSRREGGGSGLRPRNRDFQSHRQSEKSRSRTRDGGSGLGARRSGSRSGIGRSEERSGGGRSHSPPERRRQLPEGTGRLLTV